MDMPIEMALCLVLESPSLGDYLIAQTENYMNKASYTELAKILLTAYGMTDKSV